MTDILESLGCKINPRSTNSKEIRSTRPGGDDPTSLQVYIDTLNVNCYTEPLPRPSDIITLVQHYKEMSFSKAMYYICLVCGYEYYASNYSVTKPENDPCMLFLDSIEPKEHSLEEVPLRIIDESILNTYIPGAHILFLNEGISCETQNLFEIGYSIRDNCITIPIRDDLGNLVGVKGRTTLDYKKTNTSKYWFPVPTPKTKILYGLDKTYSYIKDAGHVFVFEGEKSVQKAWSFGIRNSVSIGGHELSETQIMKLERLGVEIVLALDNNITPAEIKAEAAKFVIKDQVFSIYAHKNRGILGEKDAPIDKGLDFFNLLVKEEKYRVRI